MAKLENDSEYQIKNACGASVCAFRFLCGTLAVASGTKSVSSDGFSAGFGMHPAS